MRKVINTKLPVSKSPFEWATMGENVLYTAQIPIRADGSIETGDIIAQATLTFGNLKQTVEAAGRTTNDVTQVLAYLVNKSDGAGMNEVYRKFFSAPFPNRATVVADLMVEGALIEVIAYAHIKR